MSRRGDSWRKWSCRRSLATRKQTCRSALGAPAAPWERKLTPSLCSWLKRSAKQGASYQKNLRDRCRRGGAHTARQAVYSEKDVPPVAPDVLEKYFERINGSYVLNGELESRGTQPASARPRSFKVPALIQPAKPESMHP